MPEETRHQTDLTFEQLQALILDLDKALKKALGFTRTLRYHEIIFNVSKISAVANITPLAFVHLTEPIDPDCTDTPAEAVGLWNAFFAFQARLMRTFGDSFPGSALGIDQK